MTTTIDTANLSAGLKAVSEERVRLGLEASAFYKAPRDITKDGYLTWKSQRRTAYREITRLIRILKRIARSHRFSEGGYDQPRAQSELLRAKGVASDLMAYLATAKDANTIRYKEAHTPEHSTPSGAPGNEAA